MAILRAEVIEVYNDLSEITEDKIDQLMGRASEAGFLPRLKDRGDLGFENRILRTMPRDSVRAKIIGETDCIICYPFFPPHLRMPVKVGEEVWVLFDDFENSTLPIFDPERASHTAESSELIRALRSGVQDAPKINRTLGYWMCRPTQQRHIDDTNYTAFGRARSSSSFSLRTSKDEQDHSSRATYTPEFPTLGNQGDSPDTITRDDANLVERIRSFSSTKFAMEPVARFTKLPGDLVLQGSNDSRIVLGSLRLSEPSAPGAGTGAIDLVAGTGNGANNAPLTIQNAVSLETDKDPRYTGKTEPAREGDPEVSSDASRLLIAESVRVDDAFPDSPTSFNGTDVGAKSGPSIAARAQHIRMQAGEDGSIRIVVEGPNRSDIVIDAQGNLQITAETVVSVQAPKIFLGTTSEAYANGVVTGSKLAQVTLALRTDFAAIASSGSPTNVAILAAFANTISALSTIGPLGQELYSKTVFASS